MYAAAAIWFSIDDGEYVEYHRGSSSTKVVPNQSVYTDMHTPGFVLNYLCGIASTTFQVGPVIDDPYCGGQA